MLVFMSYLTLIILIFTLSEHSQVIITVALCGFANLASMAILLGGLGALAPSRRADIARMGLKAVLAGSLSNFMSAALVGIFFALKAGIV